MAERRGLHLQNRGEHLVLGVVGDLRAPVEHVLAVLQELELVAWVDERVVHRFGGEASGVVVGKLVAEEEEKGHGTGAVLEGDGGFVEGGRFLR